MGLTTLPVKKTCYKSIDDSKPEHSAGQGLEWPEQPRTECDGEGCSGLCSTRARMHHKVVGNFGSKADVRSLYFRGLRFNETSDNGACTHGQPAK